MSEEVKDREKVKESPMSFMTLVLITGFVGGILAGTLGYFAYLFNMTDIPTRVILEPWAIGDWKKKWLGIVISIIFIGVFSMVAAIIYYAMLRKLKSMWVGIMYGLALFLIVFLVLNPIFPGIKPIGDLDLNTLVTSICLYALFGLFVGYTISYEENEVSERNKQRENDEVPST